MSDLDHYRVKPGKSVNLSKWDPDETLLVPDGKKRGELDLVKHTERLAVLQELLYAEGKHKLLVVLQAMDTGGKDGTIRHVFKGVNPAGVRVAAFKQPTGQELAHDFLWRAHAQVPAQGEIAIFNRSHYEDVLVVRVHKLVPKAVWRQRYDQINDFERLLAQTGTTILKFYLHIDKDEQKKRLESRLQNPHKRWKFRRADLEERKLWPDYQQAYEGALSHTSTKEAPWYIVPANAKWYRNVVVVRVIVEALEKLKMSYPKPEDLDGIVIE